MYTHIILIPWLTIQLSIIVQHHGKHVLLRWSSCDCLITKWLSILWFTRMLQVQESTSLYLKSGQMRWSPDSIITELDIKLNDGQAGCSLHSVHQRQSNKLSKLCNRPMCHWPECHYCIGGNLRLFQWQCTSLQIVQMKHTTSVTICSMSVF